MMNIAIFTHFWLVSIHNINIFRLNKVYLIYIGWSNIGLTWKNNLISFNYHGQPNLPGIWIFAQWSVELRCITSVEGSCHSTICFWFCPDFSAPYAQFAQRALLGWWIEGHLRQNCEADDACPWYPHVSPLASLATSWKSHDPSSSTHMLTKVLSHNRSSKIDHI